jgi:hypothetical protein
MFLALLHGEVFPAFTTDPFNLAASCVEALLLAGTFSLSLFRKECFCSFQTLPVLLLTLTEGRFLTEKNYDVASFAQEFCTGSIPSLPRLEHGDDGWSFPLLTKIDDEATDGGVAC